MCRGGGFCQLARPDRGDLPSGMLPWLRDRRPASTSEPFDYLRGAIAFLMVGATIGSVVLAITGIAPKAWTLAAALWALYGLVAGVLNGVFEPFVDWCFRVLSDVGLRRSDAGFSEIETLESRGEYAFAAERYRERADRGRGDRVSALARRAALLAGPLKDPARAVAELEALREPGGRRLTASDEILLGTTLAHLYEHRLNQPGRAMVEFRRLIDAYPESHHARHLRRALAALRADRFGLDS